MEQYMKCADHNPSSAQAHWRVGMLRVLYICKLCMLCMLCMLCICKLRGLCLGQSTDNSTET